MFKTECFGDTELDEARVAQNVALTQQVFMVIEQELQLTGFWESIPASNKLQSEIQKILLSPDFIKLPNIVQNRKRIISRIMELAKKNNDTILYAD
jgi:type I restriction enzyme R subunit